MVAMRLTIWLAGAFLILTTQTVFAAPKFVAVTRVTGDETQSTISIRFNCKVSYVHHDPLSRGDRLRINVQPSTICNGVSPIAAQSRGRYRPVQADLAALLDIVYEGDAVGGPVVGLNFEEVVDYQIRVQGLSFSLEIDVVRSPSIAASPATPDIEVLHRQVLQETTPSNDYVINLASFDRIPTVADLAGYTPEVDAQIYYLEEIVNGERWFRLRLGLFNSSAEAELELIKVVDNFQDAWVDQVSDDDAMVALEIDQATLELSTDERNPTRTKVDTLMTDARLTMVSGDRARAIQVYTKVLQMPANARQQEAQELLALAREKSGQIAHATAEYRRYLSVYPEGEGATRVGQRLAALLSSGPETASGSSSSRSTNTRRGANDWRIQTFFSQYYRRDVNQQNDRDEIVSQSALYSDVNFDARRRGTRFDFSSRITAGYRSDFLDEGFNAGNDTRISYAYADLADAKTGLRGRIGRQSRNTGGVLGRFDGINLGYLANERLLVNAVIGKPAYSSKDGVDSSRTFYGMSVDYGPIWKDVEFGMFFVHQEIEGITDRQAIGGEFRYFGESQSFWGQVDYDTEYKELSSAFLQTSWRVSSRLSINGSLDRRHTPFLSTGNAIIGQPVVNFSELAQIFNETELRELGLDRSPVSNSYSLGASYTLSPRLQISVDGSQTSVDESPASGGILATPANRYSYYSTNLIASSLFREGDVTIIGLRQSDSSTSKVLSLTLDSRYPFSRRLRINPRLRIDRRERINELDYEWIYTPGLRIQYRRSQKFRIDFEAGKQFTERQTELINLDRESYFVNLGYQVFF